ncbi:MAG: formate dehydrogenase subunit delta [Luteimonas sp.]
MNAERLAEMANDIAAYFQAEPDHATAVDGMVAHILRFWEPRMRVQIIQHLRAGDADLMPLAAAAIGMLARKLDESSPPPHPNGGGD